MPPGICIERANPNEPVYAGFRFQKAVGIGAADLQCNRFNPFIGLQLVKRFNGKPVPFGPAEIHAGQHARPIAGFGAARPGMNR